MNGQDLHSALKTSVVAEAKEGGIEFEHVRLQQGRDRFLETIHAHPATYTSAGPQTTDFLPLLGFDPARCAFHTAGECYCRVIPEGGNVYSRRLGIHRSYCTSSTPLRAQQCVGCSPHAHG